MRKAQITIYVIVGIVVLMMIAALSQTDRLLPLPIADDPESTLIQACIESELRESVDEVASAGISREFIDLEGMPIPVYQYGVQRNTPHQDAIQSALKTRWADNIRDCVREKEFRDIEVIIGEDEVSGVVEVPVQVNSELLVKRFAVQVHVRIPTYLSVLDQIFSQKDVPADVILDLIDSKRVDIDVVFDQDVLIYVVSDETQTGKDIVWLAAKVRAEYPQETRDSNMGDGQ